MPARKHVVPILIGILLLAGPARAGVIITNFDTFQYPKIRLTFTADPRDVASRQDLQLTETRLGVMSVETIVGFECVSGCAPAPATPPRGPIYISLVIDTSGSMDGTYLQSAKNAAVSIINNNLKAGDYVRVWSFKYNSSTGRSQPQAWPAAAGTTDRSGAVSHINGLTANGPTPMYDTVNAAASDLGNTSLPRYMVVISDGADNDSVNTIDTAVNRISANGVRVYSVFANGQFAAGACCNIGYCGTPLLPACKEQSSAYVFRSCGAQLHAYEQSCRKPFDDSNAMNGMRNVFIRNYSKAGGLYYIEYLEFVGYRLSRTSSQVTYENPMYYIAQRLPSLVSYYEASNPKMVTDFAITIGNQIGAPPSTTATFRIDYQPSRRIEEYRLRTVELWGLKDGSTGTSGYREPGPSVGTGTGVLGDAKWHVDSYYEPGPGSRIYYLQDVSRRASYSNLNHGTHHSPGDMLGSTGGRNAGSSIVTLDDWGLVYTSEDNYFGRSSHEKAAVDAHVHAGMVYEYLFYGLDWLNSFDGNGGTMVTQIKPPNTDEAWWDPLDRRVIFGGGLANYPALSAALDIVGHEWGHAITDVYCENAGYNRNSEFEALAEAFSDWVGIAVKHHRGGTSWKIGEGVRVLRDLANPSVVRYRSPEWETADKYGKAGVANKMFHLLVTGDAQLGIAGIGMDTAMRIALLANKREWRTSGDYGAARRGMIAVAAAYGPSVQTSVRRAWDAVGVTEAVSNPGCFFGAILPIILLE